MMQMMQMMNPPTRKFMEFTLTGGDKKLYIPSDSIRTYEEVPAGKNPEYPDASTFLRYDYGEGLMFAMVNEPVIQICEDIGSDGWLALHSIDDAVIMIRNELVVAIQEKYDAENEISATQVSLQINGQTGPIFVKDTFEEIKAQRPN